MLPALLALPVVCGVLLSFVLEQQLEPRPRPVWRRSAYDLAIHLGLWLLFFAFELAIFQRPWFAVVMVLSLMLPVVLVSNAKFHSLHEPFIFQDFEYFADALKHPRLYFPFLNLRHVTVAIVMFAVAVLAGISIEPSLIDAVPMGNFLLVIAFLSVAGALLMWFGTLRKPKLSFVPGDDLVQLGLLPCLWHYGREERRTPFSPLPSAGGSHASAGRSGERMPDLIVVQSESFFDVRRAYASIRPEILGEYDSLRSTSSAFGALDVPAWGANTVRTEFAFLSGIRPDSLGIHRFNPYRQLAGQGTHTLATYLRRQGYRTICVHPYPASFYRRDKVYPVLGFDEFVDIRSFGEEDKFGPYVGDVAVANKACSYLDDAAGQPLFLFVITMENHGPLHLERARPGETEALFLTGPPAGCDDLTIYLRHLANADRMIGRLRSKLEASSRPAVLCWFGDHVPIMPRVYELMGKPDGRTDYVIWTNGVAPAGSRSRNLRIEELAGLLMDEISLFD